MHEMFHKGAGHTHYLRAKLQLLLAPNPSPMTGPGTNTYLLGDESLAIIDPGPLSDEHLTALLAAIAGRHVSHIVVTHSHLDHSPLARVLADRVDAPVLAFGDSFAGRSAVMQDLAAQGMAGGGEGLDLTFLPDERVFEGAQIVGADWTLEVMHTPGHLGNHISLVWEDAIFVGDVVMDWSTSLVSPPEGDMSDFLNSCRRLHNRTEAIYFPGHGAPLLDPKQRLSDVIAHREARTAAILAALEAGGATVNELVAAIYLGLDPRLAPAAGRNVFAHLVALVQEDRVVARPRLGPDARFALR